MLIPPRIGWIQGVSVRRPRIFQDPLQNVSRQTYKRGIQISCRYFQNHDTKVFYMTFTCMTRPLVRDTTMWYYELLRLFPWYVTLLCDTSSLYECFLGTWYYYVILRAYTSVSLVRVTIMWYYERIRVFPC